MKSRPPGLENSELRNERDTAVYVLIALNEIGEARRVFDTYGGVTRYDFSTDQVLKVYEGKGIDIAGIRFVTLWGQDFGRQVIVPALWAAGRHDDACEVLGAMTATTPWIAHPGKVDCPATNAAYKERWGFDPPWTLPQDEILSFLRQTTEAK